VIRINAGCGPDYREGWINFDLVMREGERRDLIADVRRFPFKDGVADRILLSQVLEHLTYEDGEKVISECWRVLKDKGVLTVWCPNALFLAERWIKEGPYDIPNIAWPLLGAPGGGDESRHKSLYDRRNLPALLRKHGFRVILIDDKGRDIKVEAIKVGKRDAEIEGKAILVFGPESSGTRLMTKILMKCGCIGDGDHYQRFDEGLPFPDSKDMVIVWRRSFPHASYWPNAFEMVEKLRKAGYTDIRVVVMSRDWYPSAMSQNELYHSGSTLEDGMERIREAYRRIFDFLIKSNLKYVVVNYEALIQRPGDVMRWVCAELGIPFKGISEELSDENVKWYEGRR